MMGDFYGTGIEIWPGFGPIGSNEKKNGLGQLWATFEGVDSCFQGQKNAKQILKTL